MDYNPFADKYYVPDEYKKSKYCEIPETPIYHGASKSAFFQHLSEINDQKSYFKSYFTTCYKIYDSICGHHYGDVGNGYYKGYLDIFILPLISRKMFYEMYNSIKQQSKSNEYLNFKNALRALIIFAFVVPLEIARIGLSLAVTVPFALIVAPFVPAFCKCSEDKKFDYDRDFTRYLGK